MKKITLNERNLRRIIGQSVRKVLTENISGTIEILPDGNYEKGSCYRPNFCYADGKLEQDLGYDYFYLSACPVHGNGKSLPTGRYECSYNGRPCSLYVMNMGNGRQEGLCCYDDDIESKASILDQLF